MNDNLPEHSDATERTDRLPLHVQLGCKPFKAQLTVCAWILVVAALLLLALLYLSESGRDQFGQTIRNVAKWANSPAAPALNR